MNIDEFIKYIKIDNIEVFQKNQFCIPNGGETSCKKSVANELQLEQEGDISAECIYKETWQEVRSYARI